MAIPSRSAVMPAIGRWSAARIAREPRIRLMASLAPSRSPQSALPLEPSPAALPATSSTLRPFFRSSPPTAAKTIPLPPIAEISSLFRAPRQRSLAPHLDLALTYLRTSSKHLLPLSIESPAQHFELKRARNGFMLDMFERFARHPLGLDAARKLMRMIKDEGLVPTSKGLTAYLKTLSDTLLDSNSIPSSSTSSRAASESPLAELRKHLDEVLALTPRLDRDLLVTILSLHIRLGTSPNDVEKTIRACMSAHGEGLDSRGKWPPAMFGIMIQANKKAGNRKEVTEWFFMYRKIRQLEIKAAEESGEEIGKEKRQQLGKGWWDSDSQAWPYTTFFDAVKDKPSSRATGETQLVRKVLACMREDQVEPSRRLLVEMMTHARMRGSYSDALAVWKVLSQTKDFTSKDSISDPDIRTIHEVLHVMRLQQGCGGEVIPLLPIVEYLFPDSKTPPFVVTQSPQMARTVFAELLATVLSPPYSSFQLAYWILSQLSQSSLAITDDTVDRVSRGLLRHWVGRIRPEEWVEVVLGKKALEHDLAQRKRMLEKGSRVGLWTEHARLNGPRVVHWDVLLGRLMEVEAELGEAHLAKRGSGGSLIATAPQATEEMVLPLAMPLARLVDSSQELYTSRDEWSSTSITLHDAWQRAMERRDRGELDMKDRIWKPLMEVMRRAAIYERDRLNKGNVKVNPLPERFSHRGQLYKA